MAALWDLIKTVSGHDEGLQLPEAGLLGAVLEPGAVGLAGSWGSPGDGQGQGL